MMRTLLLPFLALVAGCALSPQTIDVAPQVESRPGEIGRGRTLSVKVRDVRAEPWFGTLGGIYSNTAYIQPRGDFTPAVRRTLEAAFAALGFRIVPAGDLAQVEVDLAVVELSYQGTGEPTVRKVETAAEVTLRAAASVGGDYTGRSRVAREKDVIGPPDVAANAALINETLADALERMLSRRELGEFLAR